MAIEDLSDAHWPPPWDPALIEATLKALAELHASAGELPTFREMSREQDPLGWLQVDKDPGPFLGLGLTTAFWLEQALPILIEASGQAELNGPCPIHADVRSDNLCRTERGVVLVDWNFTCLGNPEMDIAFWLPSLAFEGGPLPEQILPDSPQWAAEVSGYFAARAGLPDIPDAPFVRRVQREQLSTALSWAIRALGLPPSKGTTAPPSLPR